MMMRPVHFFHLICMLGSWQSFTNALRYQDSVRIPYPSSDEDLVFDDIMNEISDATASRIKFKAGDDLSRSQVRLEGSGAVDQDDTEIDGSGSDGRASAFNVKPTAPPADGAARYRLKINITSIKFDPATLGDMYSAESQILAIELDDRITSLFQDVQGNQTAFAEGFEKSGDGIITTVHLTSWGNENQQQITDRIKAELNTGRLGFFNTTSEGFVLQSINENPNVTTGMRCKPADFWCRDGGCVDLDKHCNGVAECTDKSDEEGCESKLVAVLVHPVVQSISEGQRATFFCGSGNLRHQVAWTKKGGGPLPVNVKVNRGQLQIQNSTLDNAGEYECTAVRSLPSSSALVTLNVASKSAASPAADPEVALSIAQVYAYEGQDAEIACDVEGESSATWSRIDGELPTNSNVTQGKLLITDVQFADAGLYECRPVGAETADGAQSVAQVIVIPDPRVHGKLHLKKRIFPKITHGNLTITEGEAVFLRCESMRKGVEVEWLRDALPFSKDVVISGENLTSLSAKLIDTGKYHCRHKGNKLEQVSTYLTVLPAPTTTTTTTTTTAATTTTTTTSTTTTTTPATTTATTTTTPATTTTTTPAPTTTSTTEAPRQASDFNRTSDVYITVQTGEDSQVVWVDEGASYIIRCVAPDGGAVEWTALDGQILNEDGNGLLRINRASVSTTGLFRCHWQSDHSASVAVDVRLSSSRKEGGWSELQVFVTPRIYIARRDESPFFECNAPVDAGEVRWARMGRELPVTARVSGTRLTFTFVREIDEGVYVCYVSGNLQGNLNGGQLIIASSHRHDDGGTWDGREGAVLIRVGDSYRTVYIERDRSISLTCHSEPDQEVEWSRADGIPLPPSARIEGATLTISSVDVKSSGQYICRTRDARAGQQTLVELITYPAGWKGGRFTGVQVYPDRLQVNENDDIVLDCQPSDYSAMVEWSRAGFELPREAVVNEKRLTIRPAVLSHSGFYICRVVGEASGSQNIAQVSVRPKRSTDVTEIPGGEKGLIRVHIVRVPSETDNIFHEERKPLRLTCLSPDGAPVRWERQGGQPLPPDSRVYGLELLFDNPTTDASGTYVCVLERFPTTMSYVVLTIVGEVQPERPQEPWAPSENVLIRSSVVVTPASIRVEEGSQVILECHSQGGSRIVWSKTDGFLPAGVSPYDNQLTVNSIQQADAGQYVCTAIDSPVPNQGSSQVVVTSRENDDSRQPEGEASRPSGYEVTLYVYPGPEVRQKEGETAVLDCLSSDANVLVEWKRISSPRRRVRRQDSEAGTGRLIIENAKPSDSGVYECRIKNRRSDQPDVVETVKLVVGDVDDSDFVIHQEPPSPSAAPRTTPYQPQYPPTQPAYTPAWPTYERPTEPSYPSLTQRPVITRCRPNEATCMSGQCIPRAGICDGRADCNDGSDEKNCDKCDPTEMKCGNGKCVQKIWACDGENDCGDNSDEQDCPTSAPGSQCAANQFLCESGDQCYPRNFQCDGTVDCQDSSDEIGCAGPTISKPPVETQEVKLGDTVTITCEAVGFPTPLISWRLNWGNVPPPPRVTATSVDGVGVLTIRNFQESDQGAYSCEAVNNMNAIIATPDSFVTLEGTVSDICRPPLFNAAARNPSECLQCFCSGITQDCRSCSLYLSDITSSSPPALVSRDGSPVSAGSVRFDAASGEVTIERVNEIIQLHSPSWQLPEEFIGDQVASYGSNLTYAAKYGPRGGRPTFSPDVIIGSNDVALYYRAPQSPPQANVYTDFSVPLIENAWSKRIDSRPGSATPTDVVTRDDMMKVLQRLEYIRVKALYDTLSEYSSIRNVKLGTAISQDSGRGRATLVEQCICPPGYAGHSCERCAAGYQREATRDGVSARCVLPQAQPEQPVAPPPAPEPELPGGNCDPNGSAYPYPDPRTGQCTCKENTVGPRCDQCRTGSFFLNADSTGGCELCFCLGVTQDCRSAPWYRDAVRVEARNALEEGLIFTTADRSATYTDHLGYNSRDDLVVFERPITDPNDVLYWQLPRSIAGNRITSYGGRLNVNLRAEEDRVPGQRDAIHIRIFGNGITLNHNSTQPLLPGRILQISAPFRENFWSREDGQFTTKEHLLMALADLEYVLVLMPSSFAVAGDRSAGIGSISIDIAQPRFNGQPLAFTVELCRCPPGYKGSSCEDCDQGYTRSEGGLYLGVCEACQCNGHSEDCDPESGICRNCRDGTSGNHCEVSGGPVRPWTPPSRPDIQVVVEPRYVDATSGDYVVINCDVRGQGRPRAVWTRADRRALPLSAAIGADNSLTFRRIEENDGGVYVCTARAEGRPDIVGSADTRINVQAARPVVRPTSAPIRPMDQSLMVYVVPPKSQTVRVGATVQFHCVVRSPSTYTAAWTKIGGKLPSRDSDVAGVLTIVNAQPRDSGSYVCTGSNLYRTATDGARLIVEGEPTMPEDLPEPSVTSHPRPEARPDWQVGRDEAPSDVRIEPYFLRVREGEPVEFKCLSSGYPEPVKTWSGGPSGAIRPPASVDADGVLRISSARAEEHEGEWVCASTNAAGSQTARTVLYVTREQGVPEVHVDAAEVQARPGEPVQLRCSSFGDPAPVITWTKTDGSLPASAIQQGGILSIGSVAESDQGTYVCIGTSPQGTHQAEVRLLVYPGDRQPLPIAPSRPEPQPDQPPQPSYPAEPERPTGSAPTAVIEPQSISAFEGENVHIVCRTGGSPTPTVRWYRHGGDPDERHKFNETTYSISGVRGEKDRGIYFCAAESSVGLAQASAIIDVEGKEEPRIDLYPSATQSVQPGEGTFFQCQVVAGIPPPNITWTRTDGKPLTQKTNIADRPDVISFSEVSAAEAGSYTCTAQNKHGSTSATANLQVQGSARVLITPSGPIRRTVGEDVEVECTAEDQPNARVTWKRSSTGATVIGPDTGLSLLRLPNAQESDSDNYVCEVDSTSFNVDIRIEPSQRPFDSSALIPTRVPFPDDAVIRIEPIQQTVRPGENARLVCIDPEAGLKQIEYIWEREDGQPLPRSAIRNGNYLDFENIRAEEGGRYICLARTDVSTDRAAAEIYVHTEPNQPISVTESPEQQLPVTPTREDVVERSKDTVLRGQRAAIQCGGLDLSPNAQVTWAKREGTMPKQHRLEGTTLVIENVSENDAGNYICSHNGRDSTTVLVVADVVPRFRGRRDSYAVLPSNLHKTAYFELDMDIRFKPESANGLIVYNGYSRDSAQGAGPSDFIALGMKDGLVEFRFDVGAGPAILQSQRPLELNKWHHARIWRSKREATLTVDDEEPVTGMAPGSMVGLELVGDLHVGGVPDYSAISRRVGFSENFAGCVGLIKAGNMFYDVFLNATEKHGVEDCNTCAQENPCQNNGICQNALTPWGYKCHCPRGFTGNNCEISGFRCINGICGEGRCVDTEDSFLCICPWGKGGKTCNEDVRIDVPSFSKRSYAAYATPRNVLSRLNMDLVFKARSSDDGIILYAGAGENGLDDFFSLAIKDRSLELRFDTGSGHAVLRSMVEIRLDTWYKIRVERTNQAAEMKINDEETVTGNSPGSLTGLNLRTNLYLGGVSEKVRVAQGVQVQNGFDGCISMLDVNGVNYNLGDSTSVLESAGVTNCEDSSVCARQPCRRGVCLEEGQGQYRCECPEGFTGTNCETEDNICTKLQPCLNGGTCVGNGTSYQCNCNIGFSGENCNTAVNVESDVGFSGNGFFEFPGTLLPHAGAKEADFVALSFKTTPGSSGDGLLLWQGQKSPAGNTGDYLSLALENGRLMFRYELGSGPAVIAADESVNDGEWHNVKITRTVKRGELTVDDRTYTGESRGKLTKLDTTGNIFIGGAPNVTVTTANRYKSGFSGCIRDVQISTSEVLKLREHALNGQNVGSCPT